ncbi:unnamed protein product [Microthlaspi erraticum]|uniref:F-box associated beta-propeller type 1 domain-containing protein n=1 Tax=Microthlaspi erraticum TaxID=1685480 RepID=A0A6D2HFE5_9BRAS|nr:unnamed protein product [Microthlaspi erraticum]
MRRSSSRNLKKILARVPVKDLTRFVSAKVGGRCSKTRGLSDSTGPHAPTRIVSFRKWNTRPCLLSYSSSGKPEVIVEEISLNIGDEHDLLNANPIGQCHGLFCLDLDEDDAFGVWNPSLRELRRIEIEGLNDYGEMGFGYDHSSQDYKIVFVLETQGSDSKALVLSLKSGVSRMIDFPRLENVVMSHMREPGTLVGENIYWQVYGDGGKATETFLRFDLVSDTFSYCKGPSNCGEDVLPHITAGLRGGGLCTVQVSPCGDIIVWSAQHEKDKIGGGGIKSWSKICSLSRAVLERAVSRGIDYICLRSAVAYAGLLLLLVSIEGKEAKLLAYNFEDKSLTCVETNLPIDSCGDLQTYVETLVPIPNASC